MDGNRRWARQRRLPTLAGHRAGTDNIRRIIQAFADHGVAVLTLYAFSTENWSRPSLEVRGLFRILREVIDRETAALHEAGVQVRHIGSLDQIPPALARAIQRGVDRTRDNQKLILNIAFNYGGRRELTDAVRRIVASGVAPGAVNEDLVTANLYTAGQPDPDLIIRTAGEMRLSNFLIWQAAYAEYYATPTLWPDFGPEQVAEALADYARRQRRFGGRSPE